jgi:hypothetical protein
MLKPTASAPAHKSSMLLRRAGQVALVALLSVACSKQPQKACQPGKTEEPLSEAPRNGAQMGGMTITSSGVTGGAGAPQAAADGGYGLLRLYVILDHPGSGLSSAQREGLDSTLDAITATGVLQAFLRFYYATPITSKSDASATVAAIASDIDDAADVVNDHIAHIPFIQAGFLGPWGEWWSGDLEGADFGTDQELRTLKTGVVDKLKSTFPATFIQLRYPRDIATYYADDPQIAFHDDSVLAGSDDGGTFNATKKTSLWPDGNPDAQRTWIKNRTATLGTVNAGESSESTPSVSCDTLLAYLAEYGIRVFNVQWPDAVTHCADAVKSSLFWAGPLAPGSAPADEPVPSGTELGCWATDQRPWQLCSPEGCETDRCRRQPSDPTCDMYRAPLCQGDWPPPGYPGEEMLPDPSTTGGSGGSNSSGSSGNSGSSGTNSGAAAGSGTASMGGASSSSAGAAAATSAAGVPSAPGGVDGGC